MLIDKLNRQWDPIGGCPADEHDGYVGTIAAMVRDNPTDVALMKCLERAESVHMGFGRFDSERAKMAVEPIRALWAGSVAEAFLPNVRRAA